MGPGVGALFAGIGSVDDKCIHEENHLKVALC